MTEEQFKALVYYIDQRVELQDNRETISSQFFYDESKRLREQAEYMAKHGEQP